MASNRDLIQSIRTGMESLRKKVIKVTESGRTASVNIDEQVTDINAKILTLREMVQRSNTLAQSLEEKETEILAIRGEVDAKQKEFDGCTASVTAKEAQIQQLEEQLAAASAAAAVSITASGAQEEKIRELIATIEERNQGLQATTDEAAAVAAELNQIIADLAAANDDADIADAEHTAFIEKIKKVLQDLNQSLADVISVPQPTQAQPQAPPGPGPGAGQGPGPSAFTDNVTTAEMTPLEPAVNLDEAAMGDVGVETTTMAPNNDASQRPDFFESGGLDANNPRRQGHGHPSRHEARVARGQRQPSISANPLLGGRKKSTRRNKARAARRGYRSRKHGGYVATKHRNKSRGRSSKSSKSSSTRRRSRGRSSSSR